MLRWAYAKRSELQEHSSNLEFKLHSMSYIQILEKGDAAGAISYAKRHFGFFAKRHMQGWWVFTALTCTHTCMYRNTATYGLLTIHWVAANFTLQGHFKSQQLGRD
jgi:hypothetical protein